MSWLSRAMNYLLCNILWYQMCSIKCRSLLPPYERVVLQMLHVDAGLVYLSNLI